MLIGRDYRKSISQAFAYGAYKWIAVWLIIATCASKGQLGVAAGLVVAAVDIVAGSLFTGIALVLNEQSRRDWMDRLTNRCFYTILFQELRDGRSASVDVDELFQLAAKEALADIKRAGDDSAIQAGFLDTKAWHWIGGILLFLWLSVSFGLYYGSALYLGSGGSF